jgi:hypothetical protein
MPAFDSCHPQIVRALEKEGWDISLDQFLIRIDRNHRVYIDIEAHHAESETIMMVEIKCFQDIESETTDLYTAIGQYLIYRNLLERNAIRIPLYLAVPLEAYSGVFSRMAFPMISQNHVKMIVVDLEHEVINQWLNW